MKALFQSKQHLVSDIYEFTFYAEKPLRFIPGQFIEVSLPHTPSDTRGHNRWFTLSSVPGNDTFSFITRIRSRSSSSFKQQLLLLTPKDSIEYTSPLGDFVLPKLDTIPIVAFVRGLGVTPFVSMARTLQSIHQRRHIELYFDPKDTKNTFGDMLSHAGFEIRNLSDTTDIVDITRFSPDALYYISGSERFVESTKGSLKTQGIHNDSIVQDALTGY